MKNKGKKRLVLSGLTLHRDHRLQEIFRNITLTVLFFLATVAGGLPLLVTDLFAQQDQETSAPSQLPPVEVEASSTQRRASQQTSGQEQGGFGYDQSTPSGMPFSDYSLTKSEVISGTGVPSNIATVASSISVVDNRGVYAQGKGGLSEVVQGQPGLWSSGFAGNPFDAQVVIRGFSNESVNRVSLLLDGVNLNIPRTEANTNFIFPELIERVEVTRGDATIPLGDKSIGGALNVIMKKPRQNPGLFFGAEGGSWGTDREWVAANLVREALAAGIFMGRYSQEGWRIYYGNNDYPEPVTRTGPWALTNVQGSLNWRITPRLTFDISHLISNQKLGNYDAIQKDRWESRDTRSISFDVYGYRPFDDFSEARWDNMTIGKLYYSGGALGNLDVTATARRYDRSTPFIFTSTVAGDQRWTDLRLMLKYSRSDEMGIVRNDLVLGNDHADGKFTRVARNYFQDPVTYITGLAFNNQQQGRRQSLSYYVMNQTRFWDRLIIGLGYRIENYDLPDLVSQSSPTNTPLKSRLDFRKSASQYSVGLVYDRELGSDLYYKHSRTYRFPNFDDMINMLYPFPFASREPVWLLDPEEGTLKEYAIRHWFSRNIYAGLTYYEMDMDNEIYFGPDPAYSGVYSRNLNVPLVSHSGIELEGFARFTPRWTLKGNFTKQKVIFRSNWQPFDAQRRTTEDKWLTENPAQMANLSLAYENKEWGFSALLSYHYVGTRFMINDIFNEWPDLETAKWGDIAFSQTFFDDLATLYFGINNVSDLQYSIQGSIATVWGWPTSTQHQVWWPNAGRTFYFGVKANTDFHRMRLPAAADLSRMQQRLYGAASEGLGAVANIGGWIRGSSTPFGREGR